MLASLLVLPSPVFAQDVAAVLKDLPAGTRVKLELEGGKQVTGTVVETRPDAVVLDRPGLDGSKRLTLPADDSGVIVDYSTVTGAQVVKGGGTSKSTVASFGDLQRVLTVGQKITVTDADGMRTKGTVAELSSTSLTLGPSGRSPGPAFSEAQVTRVARRGDPLKNGATVGALATWAVGELVVGKMADNPNASDAVGPIMGLSIGLGAVVGALVDKAIGREVPLFVRRRSSPRARATISPVLTGEAKGVRVGVRW